jgi:hypothetical protein
MNEGQQELVKKLVDEGCPHCQEDSLIMAAGIQYLSSAVTKIENNLITVDLSDYLDDWEIDPALVWCATCKRVLLDRRADIAITIKNWYKIKDGKLI